MPVIVNGYELSDAEMEKELPEHQGAADAMKSAMTALVLRRVLLDKANEFAPTVICHTLFTVRGAATCTSCLASPMLTVMCLGGKLAVCRRSVGVVARLNNNPATAKSRVWA